MNTKILSNEELVTIRGLPEKQYELIDVFPHHNSVRVREVGKIDGMVLPQRYVTLVSKDADNRSNVLTRGIADWLFKGTDVYLLSDPGTRLKVIKIHWDSQSSDVIDDQGRLYRNVSWDNLRLLRNHPFPQNSS